MYYYGARYYDTQIGRFISEDSASRDISKLKLFTEPQRWNMYSYAVNNPIKYIDPDGEFPDPTDAVVGACGPGAPICFVVKEAAEYLLFTAAIAAYNAIQETVIEPNVETTTEYVDPSFLKSPQAYNGPQTGSGNNPQKPPQQQKPKPVIPSRVKDQIPKEWGEGEPSTGESTGPGWKWQNPKSPNETVRYQQGKSNARWPTQRQPYVKQTGPNGQPLNVKGEQIRGYSRPSKTPDAHIPANQWRFKR